MTRRLLLLVLFLECLPFSLLNAQRRDTVRPRTPSTVPQVQPSSPATIVQPELPESGTPVVEEPQLPTTVVHDDVLTGINKAIQVISDFILPFALTAAAVGAMSMALLQTIKDLFPVRRFYQRRRMRHWYYNCMAKLGYSIADNPYERFEPLLLSLTTSGNRYALYSLPIENLCGQINSAAQIAMEYPKQYADLLMPLVATADPIDVRLVIESPTHSEGLPDNVTAMHYADARNRVAHHIQRSIDAIQITIGDEWKKVMQTSSILLSGILCGIGIGFIDTPMTTDERVLLTVIAAILGGFLAPVARDLVAALQRLRS